MLGFKIKTPLSLNLRVHISMVSSYGGRSWIRTMEVVDNRFTVCPIWPLWKSPLLKIQPFKTAGAGGRIRTPDLLITNQLLYQLSYTSEFSCAQRDNVDDYTYISHTCQHFFIKNLNFFYKEILPSD